MNISHMPKLTTRQLRYALSRIEGLNQKESCRRAMPNNRLSDPALRVEASKLERHPKIRAYIDAALSERRQEVLLTRDKKRQVLGSIALDIREKAPSRIAAIHQDNLMTGDHNPVRIEGEITLNAIFNALRPATALPSGDEIDYMKQAVLVDAADTLKTAMERAG
jgi:hypothetical protein